MPLSFSDAPGRCRPGGETPACPPTCGRLRRHAACVLTPAYLSDVRTCILHVPPIGSRAADGKLADSWPVLSEPGFYVHDRLGGSLTTTRHSRGFFCTPDESSLPPSIICVDEATSVAHGITWLGVQTPTHSEFHKRTGCLCPLQLGSQMPLGCRDLRCLSGQFSSSTSDRGVPRLASPRIENLPHLSKVWEEEGQNSATYPGKTTKTLPSYPRDYCLEQILAGLGTEKASLFKWHFIVSNHQRVFSLTPI